MVKSSKGVSIEPRTWVRRNKKLAHLIFDERRLSNLLAVQGDDWSGVADELATEVRHDLGNLAFGSELHKVAATIADQLAVNDATTFIEQPGPITGGHGEHRDQGYLGEGARGGRH